MEDIGQADIILVEDSNPKVGTTMVDTKVDIADTTKEGINLVTTKEDITKVDINLEEEHLG